MVKIIASGTITDADGNTVTIEVAQDPNGSDRIQIITTGFTKSPSPVIEFQQASGKVSARLLNCGGSADVLTDPATGFITDGG